MKNELQIPCFRELSDWPTVPALPFRISHFGRYRDGGPQGGTYAIDLVDSAGAKFPFFFDRFLGRLCYGGNFECGDDAAFIKKGSKLQMELFQLLEELANSIEMYEELRTKIDHARTWV